MVLRSLSQSESGTLVRKASWRVCQKRHDSPGDLKGLRRRRKRRAKAIQPSRDKKPKWRENRLNGVVGRKKLCTHRSHSAARSIRQVKTKRSRRELYQECMRGCRGTRPCAESPRRTASPGTPMQALAGCVSIPQIRPSIQSHPFQPGGSRPLAVARSPCHTDSNAGAVDSQSGLS